KLAVRKKLPWTSDHRSEVARAIEGVSNEIEMSGVRRDVDYEFNRAKREFLHRSVTDHLLEQ
ncbi:MAG: hypothetical protein MN733_32255, partial [Nitrososphaera sp.]|nr:hypothetical protein [Nitrososphaera sp.]